MPYVDLQYRPSVVSTPTVVALRDALRPSVAAAFTTHAPSNPLGDDDIHVRVRELGELDLIPPDVYVTVNAFDNAERSANKTHIVAAVAKDVDSQLPGVHTLVELVLRNYAIVYDPPA